MGQFLDSAVYASGGTGGGTQTPTDGKKTTTVTTPAVSSVVSALPSGGTRVYLCICISCSICYAI